MSQTREQSLARMRAGACSLKQGSSELMRVRDFARWDPFPNSLQLRTTLLLNPYIFEQYYLYLDHFARLGRYETYPVRMQYVVQGGPHGGRRTGAECKPATADGGRVGFQSQYNRVSQIRGPSWTVLWHIITRSDEGDGGRVKCLAHVDLSFTT